MPLTAEQLSTMDPIEKQRIATAVAALGAQNGPPASSGGILDSAASQPKGFGRNIGNVVTNIGRNIGRNFGRRIGEKYGLVPMAGDVASARFAATENRRKQLAELLIRGGFPEDIRSLSAAALEKLYTERVGQVTPLVGGQAQKNVLTGAQTMLVQPSPVPTTVKEYEYMLQNRADRLSALNKQIAAESTPDKKAELRKQLEAFGADPSFLEWANKQKAQAGGASRWRWEELNRINPGIKNMSTEEQQELFFSTMRESPEEAGRAAKLEEMARNGGLWLTPGQKKRDELFSATSIDYLINGGRISSRRNMYELDGIIRQLKKNPKLTGIVEAVLPDVARNQQSLKIQGDVERIITMDLRATLGAQFTADEAKQFIARSFNMLLPGNVNAGRLQRMRAAITQSQELYMDAIKYFRSNNSSLQGFEGKIFDKGDFEKAVFKAEDYDGVSDDKLEEMMRAGLQEETTISNAEFEAMRLQKLKREQLKREQQK